MKIFGRSELACRLLFPRPYYQEFWVLLQLFVSRQSIQVLLPVVCLTSGTSGLDLSSVIKALQCWLKLMQLHTLNQETALFALKFSSTLQTLGLFYFFFSIFFGQKDKVSIEVLLNHSTITVSMIRAQPLNKTGREKLRSKPNSKRNLILLLLLHFDLTS